jgi:hypothetical protein
MRVEVGEFNALKEAAVVSYFNPNNLRDIKAIKKLDVGSLYAYNPFAIGESNPHRPMTVREQRKFAKSGDDNHITRAIANSKDPSRWKIGLEYFSRNDEDDIARRPHVKRMANEAHFYIPRDAKIYDFNFDLPGRNDYVELGMSAVKQGLEEFFRKHPNDAVVFYFEHDDLKADPDDYNIMTAMGATDVGQLNYDHPEVIGTDHALYLDKSHFAGRMLKTNKLPPNRAKGILKTLELLENRAHGRK